ncbi:MAG: 30S ribosomal protein S2 [Nanoarchaeota archaeon]
MPRKKTEESFDEELKEEVNDITEKIEETIKEEVKELAVEEGKEKVEEKKVEKKGRKITKKELEEKAKKLAEKIKEEDIKGKLEEEKKKKEEILVPISEYVKAGAYIGTKVITPHVKPFVYRRRNDGIAIINTNLIDERLKEMVKLLIEYEPENFIVVCKREAGWKAVEKFSELTGVRIFTKKYPAGILTNPILPDFFETDMVFICDPWLDKNALRDAKRIKAKIFALCDTNNYTFDIDFFVPCNNKSGKSIGLIFYVLAREYLKAKGIDKKVDVEDFVEEKI